MDASQTYPLRALNVGEIFDRAITMYVRHFVPFTLIVMTLALPYAAVQALALGDQSKNLIDALNQAARPGQAAPPTPATMAAFGAILLIALLAMLLFPIVNTAVAFGVASIYRSQVPGYGRCLVSALRRFWPLLGTTLVYIGMGFGAYIGVVFAFTFGALIAVALAQVSIVLGVAAWIVVGLAGLATLILFIVFAIAYSFASYAAVIEEQGVGAAVGSSLRRVFTRVEFKKAVLMALAYLGILLGVTILSGILGAVGEVLTHSAIVNAIIAALTTSVSSAFTTIVLAVYYYDIRTRAEGLDLEEDLTRLTAPA